jgi:hypothetical protein
MRGGCLATSDVVGAGQRSRAFPASLRLSFDGLYSAASRGFRQHLQTI